MAGQDDNQKRPPDSIVRIDSVEKAHSAEKITNYLDHTVAGIFQGTSPTLEQADIDGDGEFDPFTDGMILSLYATSAAFDISNSQQLIYTPGIWEDSVETGVPTVKSLIETSLGTFQNASDGTPPTLAG